MASRSAKAEGDHGFGRGSPVREYWLARCDGFDVVRPDGRRLGRVKRLETSLGGTVLHVGRLRSRAVPTSAVETVWPARSLLVVGVDELRLGSAAGGRGATGDIARADSFPQRWEDETAGHTPSEPSPAAPRTHERGTMLRAYASRGGRVLGTVARRMRRRCEKLGALLVRQARAGWHATVAGLRIAGSRCRAVNAHARKLVARERVRLGRLLLRLAVEVAGDRDALGAATAPGRESERTTSP